MCSAFSSHYIITIRWKLIILTNLKPPSKCRCQILFVILARIIIYKKLYGFYKRRFLFILRIVKKTTLQLLCKLDIISTNTISNVDLTILTLIIIIYRWILNIIIIHKLACETLPSENTLPHRNNPNIFIINSICIF